MSITPAQQEALIQFHAITNSSDIEADRVLLERVDWDVQRAIQAKYDGEDIVEPPQPEQSSSSSRSPPETRTLEPLEVDDSLQGPNPPNGRKPALTILYPILNRVFAIISYPLTVSFSVFAFIFRLLRLPFPRFNTATLRFNFFGATPQIRPRRPPRPGNPADAAERWIRELEDETGAISVTRAAASASGVDTNAEETLRRRDKGEGRGRLLPDFWIGSYESALKVAQKDARPMCVILTCEEHDDTPEFKRSVLTDPDLVRVLTDNDFIVWGGDVRDSEAHQTSLKLSTTTFPFVGFIALHPRSGSRTSSGPSAPPQLCVLSRHEGSPTSLTSATTLHNHITNTLLPRITPILTRVKNEIRLRKQEQELIAQQDRAYKEAERRDREKVERRQAEERRKQEEEAERRRLEGEKVSMAKRREAWRLWKRSTLPAEPTTAEKAIRIVVRLPNGERLTKRFRPSESVEDLYAAVDVCFLPRDENAVAPTTPPAGYTHEYDFRLATSYPRKEIELSRDVLGDVGILKGGGNLVVEMLNIHGLEDDSGDSDEE
ncbi:hypothetical protein FRB90_011725 [Tulasnella sp. 427]|nr:hypothetical protein FRB90_011725 [Tulasnella sp. 427]